MLVNKERHLESLAQNVVGLLVAFIVLTAFGLKPMQSLSIQAILFVTSYVRSYLIRSYFDKRSKKV